MFTYCTSVTIFHFPFLHLGSRARRARSLPTGRHQTVCVKRETIWSLRFSCCSCCFCYYSYPNGLSLSVGNNVTRAAVTTVVATARQQVSTHTHQEAHTPSIHPRLAAAIVICPPMWWRYYYLANQPVGDIVVTSDAKQFYCSSCCFFWYKIADDRARARGERDFRMAKRCRVGLLHLASKRGKCTVGARSLD